MVDYFPGQPFVLHDLLVRWDSRQVLPIVEHCDSPLERVLVVVRFGWWMDQVPDLIPAEGIERIVGGFRLLSRLACPV